ncbi:MAG TPA: hypothetical protein VI727_04035 [Candidatus Brocadiaceae bacterium]|nr:hypothetical protein [Candidatus Brocadiaceae bacterium]
MSSIFYNQGLTPVPCETKPTTFNEIKQAVNSILEFAATNALSKNEKLADGYFKIKSKRLKKKCAA